jgi:transketolase
MRQAFSDAIVAAAQSDPKILMLTGDHGYALFDAFRRTCPGQYINCGVAEQNMIGVAAGLAKAGYRPIVYGLAAFVPMRVLEQIKIDVCYEELPVLLIGDGAGLVYSQLGASHQCTEDIASARSLPGLSVLSPADRFEMTAAMNLALSGRGPAYLRIGKSDRPDVHQGALEIREGEPVRTGQSTGRTAFFATGSQVRTALELSDSGIEAQVWSVPSIKPLSKAAIMDIARGVDRIVTFEEHSILGGLGAAISEVISESCPRPLLRIGIQDRFSAKCGTWEYLLHEHKLDIPSIDGRVRAFLQADIG